MSIYSTMPKLKSVKKILYHSKNPSNIDPSAGASIGASEEITIINANTLAASLSANLSLTIARAITTPAQPPKASKNLSTMKA